MRPNSLITPVSIASALGNHRLLFQIDGFIPRLIDLLRSERTGSLFRGLCSTRDGAHQLLHELSDRQQGHGRPSDADPSQTVDDNAPHENPEIPWADPVAGVASVDLPIPMQIMNLRDGGCCSSQSFACLYGGMGTWWMTMWF